MFHRVKLESGLLKGGQMKRSSLPSTNSSAGFCSMSGLGTQVVDRRGSPKEIDIGATGHFFPMASHLAVRFNGYWKGAGSCP